MRTVRFEHRTTKPGLAFGKFFHRVPSKTGTFPNKKLLLFCSSNIFTFDNRISVQFADAERGKMDKNVQKETEPPVGNSGGTGIFGIILLAAGLFNLPAILKKPASNADWMMLVIVLFLIIAGLLVLFFPAFIKKK